MKKSHVLLGAVLLSTLTLIGCDNKEQVRHDACSKAVLDFQQATIQGDKDIDVNATDKTIKKYACTYEDVTPKEELERREYLAKHPIKNTDNATVHFKNGKDWSKPWNKDSNLK